MILRPGLIGLAICCAATTVSAETLEQYFNQQIVAAKKHIGKTFWFDRPGTHLTLCPRLPKENEDWKFCAKVPRTRLIVKNVVPEPGGLGMYWFFVALSDGRTGFISQTTAVFGSVLI